jgi:acetyl-CoA carboxylase biotin carboxyl carrier protein
MEIKEIQQLLQSFDATALTRMAYSNGAFNLILEKNHTGNSFGQGEASAAVFSGDMVQPLPSKDTVTVKPSSIDPAADFVSVPRQSEAKLPAEDLIKAPLVGVYYAAPSPEAAPFVVVGQTVRKGQTLCILEAMKVMNEIQAEWDGVVEQILAGSEDIVEYGQPLFRVRRIG